MDITLEKVDELRKRTGVSYGNAKSALEKTNGNVLDALIYIEELKKQENLDSEEVNSKEEKLSSSEFKEMISSLIKKGNVTRIKIKKDDKVLADIPANAGVAATVIAVVLPQVLAVALITAVVVKLTIEIEKEDGTVEVINKYVEKGCEEVKSTASKLTENLKEKVSDIKVDSFMRNDSKKKSSKVNSSDEIVYTYKVDFDDVDNK